MFNFYTPTSTPDDWKRLLADPDKHWRIGFSARTLAYSWQEADASISLRVGYTATRNSYEANFSEYPACLSDNAV